MRWNRSRSRSPRRDPRRRPVSRSRSPIERKRHNSWYEQNKPPVRPVQDNKPPVPTVQDNTTPLRPVQTVTPQGPSQRTTINERLNGVTAVAGPSCSKFYSIYQKNYLDGNSFVSSPQAVVRSFKFNLIGDGLLYHVVHGLDGNLNVLCRLKIRFILFKNKFEYFPFNRRYRFESVPDIARTVIKNSHRIG